MRSLQQGIVSCIGNTPLVRLTRVIRPDIGLYAKFEGANPGGSIKDRPALQIILDGIACGRINEQTVVVEATSGNMGLGLAQICCYLGLQFVCVTDSNITRQHLRLLEVYGARIEVVTEPDMTTGDLLQAKIDRARALSGSIPNAFWANQYANLSNARAHLRTMAEIFAALNGVVDYVFCAASSCGTIRGCADYIRQQGLDRTRIYVADSPGSVIFGGQHGPRLIPGHGAGRRPELYEERLVTRAIPVTDMECVAGCRELLSKEALLVGGSSGAVVAAVGKVADEIESDATCVMLLPDRGERYLDTVFSDTWVREKLESSATYLPERNFA